MDLSSEAAELEDASVKTDSAFCIPKLSSFLDGLDTLKSNLKEAFSAISHSDVPFDIPPELPGIFKTMTSAFAEVDLVSIDKEIDKINALDLCDALRERIEQIKDAVLMMDYDEAQIYMQELIRGIE